MFALSIIILNYDNYLSCYRAYNEKLIKDSDKNLHLVLFYSASSTRTRIIHNWFNLLEMLTPLGMIPTILSDGCVVSSIRHHRMIFMLRYRYGYNKYG